MKLITTTRSILYINVLVILFTLLAQRTVWANKNENEIALNTLHEDIEKVLQSQNIPGFAYAIVEKDKLPIVEVLGHKELDKSDPITIYTPFRLASISKLVVGIAAMQQIEKGSLALEDRLDTLLPWLEYTNDFQDAQRIQLKHLLENTTGWNETSLSERATKNTTNLTIKERLSISASSRHSRWQPGTRHAYTNTAATVVAAIIEETTDTNFYEYVQAQIFEPLGITTASYANQPDYLPSGHQNTQKLPYRELIMAPSGSLNMSIADIAKLANEFVNTQSSLLNQSSITRMEISNTTNAGNFSAGYGFYNYARYYDGFRYRGHDGALPGWLAELSYSPKHNTGFVVLQNSENTRAFRQVVNLIHDYLSTRFIAAEVLTQNDKKNTRLSGYYRVMNPRMQERWFLERLVTSHQFVAHADADKATFSSVFPKGWKRELFYIGHGKWVNNRNEVVMTEANDPELGPVLHYGDRVFKQESVFSALVDKFVLVFWLLLLVGFLLTSVIWTIKNMRGTLLYNKPNAEIRVKQRKNITIAIYGSLFFIVVLVLGILSPVERLGNIGIFSVGLFMSTLIFFVSTLYCSFMHVKLQRKAKTKAFFIIGASYLVMQLCVVFYLLNFGVIGITTWL